VVRGIPELGDEYLRVTRRRHRRHHAESGDKTGI
jgi:hypothetical protein